ncbi:hypothetical protein BJF90_19885 [Pseudonocardia sp. CNS-004]|nr:hypothetical protein BJF90_19885 [Pseudonocardia sp. CNS-004]
MAGMAALVDRAVDLPPGAELAAVLEVLTGAPVPNARRVEVLQARSRQLAHDHALLFAEMVEVSHTVAMADVEGERDEVVARAAERFEWAAHEIAAGLTWTPTAADRELGFATALVERLPLVQEALLHGCIDRSKARVFVEYLDPATGDVTERQARLLCEKFVPLAPGLTTKQLSDRLLRSLQAIDPDLRRRRYERAVQARAWLCTWIRGPAPRPWWVTGCLRTKPPPRPPGWIGWPRPPNAPGIRARARKFPRTSTSACSTAPSTGSTRNRSSPACWACDDPRTTATPRRRSPSPRLPRPGLPSPGLRPPTPRLLLPLRPRTPPLLPTPRPPPLPPPLPPPT